jgi:hypothetical protein
MIFRVRLKAVNFGGTGDRQGNACEKNVANLY